ncbi:MULTISPECIES: PH domain-containing protein [Halobacterium]|uniref:PH domain-containing protein n=1 Tax=Halobacterium TaxID=2239 RepID=UPI00073EC4F8|nr:MULTISPECIES: PH domain-containing protein [Halobacterium]MCG1003157.1 PH domain-containing protein [Halobacterium noricense]
MNGERGETAAVDPAIPVGDTESVVWTGRPRVTVVIPAVVVGLVFAAVGLAGAAASDSWLPVVLVPFGVLVPAWRYLRNRRTQYVITDEALYKKTGVFSRAVSQASLHTVQNSAFSQSLTGSVFGYGSVEFEIAGGGDFTYQRIGDPREIRALVDEAVGRTDSVSGGRRAEQSVPGSVEQWRAVREEVRALHRSLRRRTN